MPGKDIEQKVYYEAQEAVKAELKAKDILNKIHEADGTAFLFSIYVKLHDIAIGLFDNMEDAEKQAEEILDIMRLIRDRAAGDR